MAKPPVNWNTVSMLTPGMKNLGNQINRVFINRDGTSDGAIGDYAHQQGKSGHNPDDTSHHNAEWDSDSDNIPEVRAIDVDSNLGDEVSAQALVDHIRKLPNVGTVLRYIIYNRKIYSASNGWNPQPYTGPSPHTEHIHFSGQYSNAADSNTSFNYKLEDIPMALNAADKTWIIQQINAAVSGVKTSVGNPLDLNEKIGDKANPARTVGDVFRDLAKLRGYLVGDEKDTTNAEISSDAPVARVVAAADETLKS